MDRKNSGAALKAVCLLSLLVWTGCKGKEPEPEPPPVIDGRSVLIGCEGLFGQSTVAGAAITLIKPETGEVTINAYKAANGEDLGDILQSITLADDRLLLCVNNSDKVVAVDKTSLRTLGSATVLKPRYALRITSNKTFISSLYSNKIYLLNQQNMQVTGEVAMPRDNPEVMLLRGNIAWVACWDTACRTLYGLSTATNAIVDSIALPGAAPQNLIEDAEGKIWVLSGNVFKKKAAHMVRIDPASKTVLADYTFAPNLDPLRLCTNVARDTLYFLEVDYNNNGPDPSGGAFRMGIHASALPQQAFVPALPRQYFYGLGIEPATGNVYLADPLGFGQQGEVRIYSPQGQLLKTFNTSVGPAHFYFYR